MIDNIVRCFGFLGTVYPQAMSFVWFYCELQLPLKLSRH